MMNTWLMRRPVRSPVSLRDDGAEQLVAVQAALHQQLGLALSHQFDRLGRRGVTVRRVDDPAPPEIDPVRLRDLAGSSPPGRRESAR